MKFLGLLLLCIATTSFAQQWGTLNADLVVNGNASSQGTTITASVLNSLTTCGGNCVVGTSVTATGGPSGGAGTIAGFTVGANQGICSNLGPVQLTNGGTLYAAQSLNFLNAAHNDANNNTNAALAYTGSFTQVTSLACVTLGPPTQLNGNDWDILGNWWTGGSGAYTEAQLNPLCYSSSTYDYGIRIETGHPTTHSGACVPLVPQSTYFFSLSTDCTTGNNTLTAFTVNGTLVGQVTLQNSGTGCTPAFTQIGNNEGGNNSGTTTYFQNLMVNWSSPGFSSGSAATVTNGSKTVTGLTGANSSWVGYQIILPDASGTCTQLGSGALPTCGYVVASVQSSSQITLVNSYAGTTTTGTAAWEFQPPLFWTNNALSAPVLGAGRATYWNPGVSGGIPSGVWPQCVTAACNTVVSNGASSTLAQINSAISSAPNNTYVFLPAGTYSSVTTGVCINRSNVVLRGAGANQTKFAVTASPTCNGSIGGTFVVASSDNNWKNGQSNGPVAVSGTVLDAGATTITLASVPNLVVGNPIIIDQLDDTADIGGILVTQADAVQTGAVSPGTNGPYSTSGATGAASRGCTTASSPTGCNSQQQITIVTQCDGNTTVGHACSSGSNITINPPLHMPNWSASRTMSAWWATNPVTNVGIEDIGIDSSGNSAAASVELFNAANCWVKGISSSTTGEAHVKIDYGVQNTIRNNYFFLTQNVGTSSYGVEVYSGSDNLVENNIFHAVATPLISNGTSTANVFAYNFTDNNYFTPSAQFNIPSLGEHASGVGQNLFEGNISNGYTADAIHGTSNLEVLFRNYLTQNANSACYLSGASYGAATYTTCNSGVTTVQDYSYHRFNTYIANMLGQPSLNTVYNSGTSTQTNVLGLGYGNGSVPSDQATFNGSTYNNINLATTMLWGNADSANGFGSPRFNCSEVPTFPASASATVSYVPAQFNYFTPCPPNQTLPASFYYGSKPSWWPAGKAWPIVGPDVSSGNLLICSGGTQSGALVTSSGQCPSGSTSAAANSQVFSNPAQDCYLSLGGLANGTGGILSFNENTCYAQSSSSGIGIGTGIKIGTGIGVH